jgi:hypothetical protein
MMILSVTRFVPQRVGQLTAELCDMAWPECDGANLFRSFSRLTSALYHYELYDREQAIIEAWDHAITAEKAVARAIRLRI